LAFVDSANTVQIAENMVAFANTEGGVIIVGHETGGSVAGASAENSDIDRVLRLAEGLYNPPVVVEHWEEVARELSDPRVDTATGGHAQAAVAIPDSAPVYAIRVPRSTELHAMADGRVLIRSGKVNRPLGGQEIQRLASAKNTGDFETEAVPGATIEDFSRSMIDEYLEKRAERTKRPHSGEVNRMLAEIGAVTADGKPTVCGLLLFSEYPQRWLPQSGVVFAKFVGTTPRGESWLAGYTRPEELPGPVTRLVEATWRLISLGLY